METSIYLAQVMGLFGAIATFTIILRYKFYVAMEANVAENLTTIYMSGFLFLLLGILIVVSHQVWAFDWRLIITILGWVILAKGLMRILFPETTKSMLLKKQTEKKFIFGEIAVFLLSLYLIFKGFINTGVE
ncbi:MAG TPA: hypothetical protein VFG10_07450 [Saprospiraceae bacterium]|nr:hypothetical protein [Saprospiraceae bacterium]